MSFPHPTLLGKGDYYALHLCIHPCVCPVLYMSLTTVTAWCYFIFKMSPYNTVLMVHTPCWGSCIIFLSGNGIYLAKRFLHDILATASWIYLDSHCNFVILTIRNDQHTITKMFDLLLHSWHHIFMSDLIDWEASDHYLLNHMMDFLHICTIASF